MLDYLIMSTRELQQLTDSPERASDRALLERLEKALGGEAVVSLPNGLMHERLCRDYKTALTFFDDFTQAVTSGDTASLRERYSHLDYLLQGGEPDTLRVSALATAYADCCERMSQLKHRCKTAVSLSPEMQQALLPFYERLPELRRWPLQSR